MRTCRVWLATDPRSPVEVGLLRYLKQGRTTRCVFRYSESYLNHQGAFALDPIQLALQSGDIVSPDDFPLFNGLRDSSPDAWGRHLLERLQDGPLDEFDFLTLAGSDRVGALLFETIDGTSIRREPVPNRDFESNALDLDDLREFIDFYDSPDDIEEKWRDYLVRGLSLGGARPKATLVHDNRLWLSKFARPGDTFDIVRSEFATMRIAKACGLDVPEVRLIHLSGRSLYLIERFDRVGNPSASLERIPFISALTLLGAHESESTRYGYSDLVAAVRAQGVNVKTSSRELLLRAAFNILVNNTDDHLRNHGFLRTPMGWKLSPLYDVVPFPERSFERFLALKVGPQGRRATIENLVSAAGEFGLARTEAQALIDPMINRVSRWREDFAEAGVNAKDIELLEHAFRGAEL